jgi:tight adherence protein C
MLQQISNIPILIAALAFIVTFLLSIGILQYIRLNAKRHDLKEKIQQGGEIIEVIGKHKASTDSDTGMRSRFLKFLDLLGQRVVSDKSADYPTRRLRFIRAGIHRNNFPAIFWGTKCFIAICFLVCFLMLRLTFFKIFDFNITLGLALLIALMGFYLPDIWLRIKIDRRKAKMFDGLPDALDLLVVCVEAGMGLDAAINRSADELQLTNKVLSDELKLLNAELRAGQSRQNALRNLAVRTDLEDLNSLVTLLIQADKFGTSVSRALRVYSDTFRTKRYQKAEETAAKIPVKLVFPCILFIFPSLFVAILGPALLRVYDLFLKG